MSSSLYPVRIRFNFECNSFLRKGSAVIVFIFFGNLLLFAQNSSLRCQQVRSSGQIVLNDSFLIAPTTIQIQTVGVLEEQINFNFQSDNNLILISNPDTTKTIQICYRVFPIIPKKQFYLFDAAIRQNPLRPDYANPEYVVKSNADWWSSPGIDYSGNFTRGISSGNNQSLVLNSSLNLQMSGDLGEGFSILGAISDNQIPIQPEGNTRQIQEFDKLFIRLSKNMQHLTAGDFEVNRPAGYFMNYYKKNKGGVLETKHQLKSWELQTKSAFAISKGKSNRLSLKTQNGNQGPYRLYGINNEQFIIMLASSEKVWLDGELLVRGEDADYTVDYNLAEIRFSTRRIISENSRVIIEFEYLDQNYTRSLEVIQTQFQNKKFKTYFNVFNEQDSKQPAIDSDLDSLDRAALNASGDNVKLAVRSGIRKAGSGFNLNRIYYRERDTVINIQGSPTAFKYLLYDPNADSSALQVGFSEVLNGQGHYILKLSTANGRVYEWRAPDPLTGKLNGNYEPVIPLIAPRRQFMVNAGLEWQRKPNQSSGIEIALSDLDKNRVSSLQDNDNTGIAVKMYSGLPILSLRDSSIQFKSFISYEFNHKYFNPINSYRSVEFERDWNIGSQIGTTDHLPKLNITANIGRHLELNLEQQRLIRSNLYKATKNEISGIWQDSTSMIRLNYNYLVSEDLIEKSNFQRPSIVIQRKFLKSWKFAAQAIRDKNERIYLQNDSLSSSSFFFDSYEALIENTIATNFKVSLSAKHRLDYVVDTNQFSKLSRATEALLESQWELKKLGRLNLKLSGRDLNYFNKSLDDSLGKLYFLGNVDHQIQFFKKAISLKNYYELQSGVEPRQEYVFEEKRPGEGNFIYMDFNKDGIRQIYEYVYAPEIDTARFVRFQLFNSEYIQIYQASWNNFFTMDARNLFSKPTGFLKLISGISFESGIRFSSKVNTDSKIQNRLDPIYFIKKNPDLVAYVASIQQNLYYNRAHPIYELQAGYLYNGQRVLLTSGMDEKKLYNPYFRSRWSFFGLMDLKLEYFFKSDEKVTQFYVDQNYKIVSNGILPELAFRFRKDIRFNLGATFKRSIEEIHRLEKASIFEAKNGFAMFVNNKLTVRSELKYISIQFEGTKGGLVEFNMLDSYKDGNNFNWEIGFDYKISSLLQLQLNYNGRKAAENEALHTGRVQLRANF